MKRNVKSLLYSFINHNRVVKRNILTLIRHIVNHEADVIVLSQEMNEGSIVKFSIHIHQDDIKLIKKNEDHIVSALNYYSNWYGTYYFYELDSL